MTAAPRAALADRVYYGWVVVVACFLASVVVFGTTYAFSVFYDPFVQAFHGSSTLLAVVFGVQTALIYGSGIGVSRLVERRGPRRVAAGSSVLLVAGLLGTAFAHAYLTLLLAFGVVAAVGMAGLYNVSYATLPRWFERRRGTATGLASAGLGVGLVVIPPGTDALIRAFGWRNAVLALAAFVAALSVVVVALFADRPSEVGADPSVEFPHGRVADDADGDVDRNVRAVVASAPFLVVLAGWTMVFSPLYVVLGHVVRHAAESGLGRSTGVLAIAVIGVTTTAARVVVGPVSDRIGRPRTFVACSVLLGSATVAVAYAPTPATLLATVAVFGIGYAGCGGLIGAVTADLFGEQSLNALFAVLSLSFGIAGLVSPPLAGYWFEQAGTYHPVFLAFGLVGVAGGGLVAAGVRLTD